MLRRRYQPSELTSVAVVRNLSVFEELTEELKLLIFSYLSLEENARDIMRVCINFRTTLNDTVFALLQTDLNQACYEAFRATTRRNLTTNQIMTHLRGSLLKQPSVDQEEEKQKEINELNYQILHESSQNLTIEQLWIAYAIFQREAITPTEGENILFHAQPNINRLISKIVRLYREYTLDYESARRTMKKFINDFFDREIALRLNFYAQKQATAIFNAQKENIEIKKLANSLSVVISLTESKRAIERAKQRYQQDRQSSVASDNRACKTITAAAIISAIVCCGYLFHAKNLNPKIILGIFAFFVIEMILITRSMLKDRENNKKAHQRMMLSTHIFRTHQQRIRNSIAAAEDEAQEDNEPPLSP